MEIIISNNANKPIYEQITSQIKAMIMSGGATIWRRNPLNAGIGKINPCKRHYCSESL